MSLLQWLCPHPAKHLMFIQPPRYEDRRMPKRTTDKDVTYRVHTCRMLCSICSKDITLTVSSDVIVSDK